MIDLYNDDCMKTLPTIKSDSVDLILCDPPYGTIKGLDIKGWKEHAEKQLGKTRGFELKRILIVAHGGSHNDTLVTVEEKIC
jgi:DNA modification methylase